MLERMRKSSRSLLIYILFGIIIAVFIISFGPQSRGGCERQNQTDTVAAQVGDQEVTAPGFTFAYSFLSRNMGLDRRPPQFARMVRAKERVMDALIERELLAQEAERLGYRVTEAEAEDFIADSRVMALGYVTSAPGFQKEDRFDYEQFRRFVQYEYGLTPRQFVAEEQRELLASRVRNMLRDSVQVSPDEVKDTFIARGNQVNLEYVRFVPFQFEAGLDFTPAEIEAYAAKNDEQLKKTYQNQKQLYEKAPRELQLRQILVRTPTAQPEEGEAPNPEATAADPAAVEEAKKKAQTLADRVRKGEAFGDVAKAASDDQNTKARGGRLGWRRKGALMGLSQETENTLFAGKPGDIVGPVKDRDGWYVFRVEGEREGDIPFEKARLELAEEALRRETAQTKAREAAQAAVEKAKAAQDKSLKELFPAPAKEGAAPSATPSAQETGLVSRQGNQVGELGNSKELADAVFALKQDSPVAGPFEALSSFVVVRLAERREADMAEYEKTKDELEHASRGQKAAMVLRDWLAFRCNEVKRAKGIRFNPSVLRYENNPDETVEYQPCNYGMQ